MSCWQLEKVVEVGGERRNEKGLVARLTLDLYFLKVRICASTPAHSRNRFMGNSFFRIRRVKGYISIFMSIPELSAIISESTLCVIAT